MRPVRRLAVSSGRALGAGSGPQASSSGACPATIFQRPIGSYLDHVRHKVMRLDLAGHRAHELGAPAVEASDEALEAIAADIVALRDRANTRALLDLPVASSGNTAPGERAHWSCSRSSTPATCSTRPCTVSRSATSSSTERLERGGVALAAVRREDLRNWEEELALYARIQLGLEPARTGKASTRTPTTVRLLTRCRCSPSKRRPRTSSMTAKIATTRRLFKAASGRRRRRARLAALHQLAHGWATVSVLVLRRRRSFSAAAPGTSSPERKEHTALPFRKNHLSAQEVEPWGDALLRKSKALVVKRRAAKTKRCRGPIRAGTGLGHTRAELSHKQSQLGPMNFILRSAGPEKSTHLRLLRRAARHHIAVQL